MNYYFGWLLVIAVAVFYYKDSKNFDMKGKIVIKYIGPAIIHIIGLCLIWSKIQGYFLRHPSTNTSSMEVIELLGFLIAVALLGAVWFGFLIGYFFYLYGKLKPKHSGAA